MKKENHWFFAGEPQEYNQEKPNRVRIEVNSVYTGLIKKDEQVHYLYRYIIKLAKIPRIGFWREKEKHYVSIQKDRFNDLMMFLTMNRDVIEKLKFSQKSEKSEEKTEYKPPKITL